MAVQPGASVKVLGRKETTFGTQATGTYASLPFFGFNLGQEQPLITPTVLGVSANRDPAAPIKDVITVSGDAEVPVDLMNIGYWLAMLLGAPVTTGTPNYTHVFKSGATTALPSFTFEQQMAQVPNFNLMLGGMCGGAAFNFKPSGEARARFTMFGQGQTNTTTANIGTSTSNAFTPFGAFQGSILRNGTSLASVAEANLNFSNNFETQRTIRSDGKVDGFIPGITNASGDISVYLTDTTLLTQATGGTSCSIQMSYTLDGTRSLDLLMPEVYLPVPKIVTPGPQGIRASFSFQGAYNTGSAAMLVATLKNQLSGY